MATTTRILDANVNGTVYTTNANSALEALDTCHSGATAPTDEVANGKLWLDTSTTPGILKIYNNATWEVVHSGTTDINGGTIDGTIIGGTTPAAVTTSSLVATTADINGGTIDGATIGGTAPSAITGTTLTATGAFTSLGINDNATATAMTLDASGNVGLGTSAPPSDALLTLAGAGGTTQSLYFAGFGADLDAAISHSNAALIFANGGNNTGVASLTERMRIDSSGNVLVNTTVTNPAFSNTANAISLRGSVGTIEASRDGGAPLELNRKTSNGGIAAFRKDGTTVGSIGSRSAGALYSSYIQFYAGSANSVGLGGTSSLAVLPILNGAASDNLIDMGAAAVRFDDIYATNGTIQTSDRNEKQDIDVLNAAETAVAQACKGLLRKFRWKDAVAEKGDDARIHFGIIAQDLQDAFTAQGLDAGNYAMFISGTWWEADRIIPAVEAVAAQDAVYEDVIIPAVLDEEGNEIEAERVEQQLVSEAIEAVEAVAEQTVTDTFETLEEAPEGATERTRLGVRYPELLAFIIAAM